MHINLRGYISNTALEMWLYFEHVKNIRKRIITMYNFTC